MRRKPPRISIGLPVYNGDAYLEQTIESLLNQEFQDFEIVIADNASTDRTPEICSRFIRQDDRIRYVRNERNLGAAANYNFTFSLARASLFKWAPHDDLYAPSYLRNCIEALESAGPRAVLCYPRTQLIDEHGTVTGEYADDMDNRASSPPLRLQRLLQHRTSWCHPVVGVIRSEALRATRLIGGYSGSDQVLLAELALQGEFHEYPESLFLRRVHGGLSPSLSENATPEARDAWFETSRGRRIAVPSTKLLLEHARAIRRAELGRRERWACYRLLWTSPFAEHWSRAVLLDEWMRALRMATWERYVVGGVRRAKFHFLPHRMWALLSGLKRLDIHRLVLAVSPPSRATHAALLDCVADALSRRSDRQSREILEEWLASDREAQRQAVTRASMKQWPAVVGPHA